MSIFKIEGTVHHLGEIETTTARSGQVYRRQQIVLEESDGNYTNHVQLRAFGGAVDETEDLRVGENVSATFAIQAREYNGRWYNDLNIIHVRRTAPVAQPEAPATAPAPTAAETKKAAVKAKVQSILDGTAPEMQDDDLPF
jgi:flagellar basal body rod protein FlgC